MKRSIQLIPRVFVASIYAYATTIGEDPSMAVLMSGDLAVHILKILMTYRKNNRKSFLTTLKENQI